MATGGSTISRAPRPSSLADVLDLILDKGLVIDAYVRVSLAGIEVLTIDARVVVASVDTYLRFAEAVSRLDLTQSEERGLTALLRGAGGEHGAGDEATGQDGRDFGTKSLGEGAASKSWRGEEASPGSSAEDGSSRTPGPDDTDPGVLGRIAERARR